MYLSCSGAIQSSCFNSTVAVVQVAAEAECKAVVLTHFSQRYPKVGKLADVCGGRAAVAFDMMTIDSKRLRQHSALLIKVLNKLFPSDDVEEDTQDPAAEMVEVAPQEMEQSAASLQAAHA